MARIRTIKPQFWEDEKMAQLSYVCRLFYIGCWNFADDQGVFRGSPNFLRSKIFPYDENLRITEVNKFLETLVKAERIIPINHNDESYYLIRYFRSHQVIDKRYQTFIIPTEKVAHYVNTTSPHSEHSGDTPQEMEKEMEKEMDSRKTSFKNSLIPFEEEFGGKITDEFYEYWSELNKSGKKMRWELQATWELSKRLGTWKRNNEKFGKNEKDRSDSRTVAVHSGEEGSSSI